MTEHDLEATLREWYARSTRGRGARTGSPTPSPRSPNTSRSNPMHPAAPAPLAGVADRLRPRDGPATARATMGHETPGGRTCRTDCRRSDGRGRRGARRITVTASGPDGTWRPGTGATLVVVADGSGDYGTIAAAVAAAPDGDTIVVRPGPVRRKRLRRWQGPDHRRATASTARSWSRQRRPGPVGHRPTRPSSDAYPWAFALADGDIALSDLTIESAGDAIDAWGRWAPDLVGLDIRAPERSTSKGPGSGYGRPGASSGTAAWSARSGSGQVRASRSSGTSFPRRASGCGSREPRRRSATTRSMGVSRSSASTSDRARQRRSKATTSRSRTFRPTWKRRTSRDSAGSSSLTAATASSSVTTPSMASAYGIMATASARTSASNATA